MAWITKSHAENRFRVGITDSGWTFNGVNQLADAGAIEIQFRKSGSRNGGEAKQVARIAAVSLDSGEALRLVRSLLRLPEIRVEVVRVLAERKEV